MELLRLNPITHLEEARYNKYESLAWNERWQAPGDFQMRSYDISGTLSFLKLGTLVSVPDTHTFAIVNKIDYTLSEDGTIMVSVSGNLVDAIFKHRPAMWMIAATTEPFRKDHEEGDELEFDPRFFLEPSKLALILLKQIDVIHYERPELAYLKLPFKYVKIPTPPRKFSEEKIPYYKYDGGDVLSNLTEFMELGNFGITPIRPGSYGFDDWSKGAEALRVSEKWPESYNNNRPSLIGFYYPDYKADKIIFSSAFDDYIGATNTISTDTPNLMFRSYEDGVMESRIGEVRPEGLHARVGYEEIAIEKEEQWTWDRQLSTDMIYPFAKANLDANSFSLETNGYHPYRSKKFGLRPFDENYYYLGDVVRIDFPWRAGYDVVVNEFIRTADSSGYREYPTFKPFVTTEHFLDTKDPISSMAYRTAKESLTHHDTWL